MAAAADCSGSALEADSRFSEVTANSKPLLPRKRHGYKRGKSGGKKHKKDLPPGLGEAPWLLRRKPVVLLPRRHGSTTAKLKPRPPAVLKPRPPPEARPPDSSLPMSAPPPPHASVWKVENVPHKKLDPDVTNLHTPDMQKRLKNFGTKYS
eukprot:gnl/TRDRNA2_/TRDRNA2_175079_c1_seq1.p1 gnl/TRDRNA2_/TRDRNA2_175079_c1~~gnl/TRDRNA2_/TRDRNA2_175079_c1_seq1.p1  ORF type:complete len:151 (+),score=18.19 gnl/TRDRNA2_/TRDRNA2_175079_c1_seq1:95-547(+)